MTATSSGLRDFRPLLLGGILLCLLGGAISAAPVLVATFSVGFLAGPHNLMEARYLLSRLPSRAGKLKSYFWLSAVGIVLLGFSSLTLPVFSELTAYRLWNTALIVWVAALAALRRQENPRREWPWLEPAALMLVGAMWAYPSFFTLILVLGHPVLALVILGRELHAFRRPELRVYYQVMAAVPVGLAVLWAGLSLQEPMTGEQIRSFFTLTAGSPVFLATHTYLELLHYAVWIGVLPWLAGITRREKLELFPALRKSARRLLAARAILLCGLLVTAMFWWGFSLDFETTRDFYFRLAIFHVLVEFPFLLRLL